jgi:hypothetical protein|tara:strand:- start:11209 stop:11514 length:306 start_codon:yes stop_codon:yes gene_type:complete
MIKYDSSILQSQTGTKLVDLILKLNKQMVMWNKEYLKMIDSSDPYIVEDEEHRVLSDEVKMLKKTHHKSLNSLKGFKGKIHSEQIKYMYSGERRERYKMSH